MLHELINIVESTELSDRDKIKILDQRHDEHPEYFDEHHPQSNANLLHYACLNSGIAVASWIIAQYPDFPHEFTSSGNNILFTAAISGNDALAEYFIHKFPSMQYARGKGGSNHHGQTIVHAAIMGGDDEILELIKDKLGVDEFHKLGNMVDHFGCTSLHYMVNPNSEIFKVLLQDDFPVKAIDNDGNALIHIAAGCNNTEFLKALLECGLDLNHQQLSEGKLTPIIIAAQHSSKRTFYYLMDHGADINITDAYNNHLIHYAAMQNDTEIMQTVLARGIDINLPYYDESTPLMIAARKALSPMFHFLLESRAKSKVSDNKDLTLAHYAATGGALTILRTTRDLAINLNQMATRDAHNIPLFYTALSGHAEAFDFLLRHDANIDYWNDAGWHIVHAAAQGGDVTILNTLKEKSLPLDLEQRNESNNTPLVIAMSQHHYLAVELILDAMPNIDIIAGDGLAPLHLAVKLDNLLFLILLLGRAENIDIRTHDDCANTPLFMAALLGHESCFDALLSKGADPNFANNNGWSCLHAACQSGHTHIIDHLAHEGINIDNQAKNDFAKTPIQIAAQNGHYNAFNYLLKAGAQHDTVDELGWHLQHHGALGGNLPILAKLKSLGIDFNVKTENGETPETIAAQNDHPKAAHFIQENS